MNYDSLPSEFAVLADRNPGGWARGSSVTADAILHAPLTLDRVNSHNHGGAGQNVLYGDFRVSFRDTPYCGVGADWQRDNIYTAQSRAPLAAEAPAPSVSALSTPGVYGRDLGPAWKHDSFLVPAEEE